MNIKINKTWSEPNGSLKSFVYKMAQDTDFRTDILCVWTFFAIFGGMCVWAVRGIA